MYCSDSMRKKHAVTHTLLACLVKLHYNAKCFHGFMLQCFDAVGWAVGRAAGLQKTEWWDAGVVICLGGIVMVNLLRMMC